MFTGIITDTGTVLQREAHGDTRFTIATAYDPADIAMGASIACSGVCLTVVEKGMDDTGNWFAVEASTETLSRTTATDWQPGTKLNLERALKMGDELGGHLVSGHVDGIGTVISQKKSGDSILLEIQIPEELSPFIAEKGSICVDGVSLTINKISKNSLNVNIIAHTLYVTTLKYLAKNSIVNIEIDLIARYVQRILRTE